MKRNWISVLLLLALTLALLPTAALAEDEAGTVTWTEIGKGDLEQLQKNGYYKLKESIDNLDSLYIGPISEGATITLDLNGHTLTDAADLNYTLWINQYSELTIIDSSKTGGGKVISPKGKAVMINPNASFTLKSGEISGEERGIEVGEASTSGNERTAFTMTGGTVTGGVVTSGITTTNLNGGTVDSIDLGYHSTIYANGGTVTGSCTIYGTVLQQDNTEGTVFEGKVTGTLGGKEITGLGTKNSPYELTTAAELKAFRNLVNGGKYSACAVLMNDIDLENEPWSPIGTGSSTCVYSGTFDGNGHTISGLNVSVESDFAGLFGVVTDGTIKNLTAAGSVTSGSTAQVNAAGGIVGNAKGCTIEGCANLCSVSANLYVGGIAGMIHNTTVRDCYNIGTVTGHFNAGGIVGMTATQSSNTIANCYNIGNVSARENACGILGYAGKVNVSNCYYLKGTAQNAININTVYLKDIEVHAPKTVVEFADGTVRDLLKAGQRDGEDPWDEKCRYVPEADKYLPVFKYQDSYEAAPESSGSSGSRFSYSTISASAGSNGKISPTGDVSVRSDLGQTFVFTPDKGCRVADVLVNGKSVGALRSYTFATARSDQTIEVVFEKIPAFVDVPAGSYYEEAVNWALENWITEGTSDTRFSPDAPCTRAQAVTFLWRAAGCPAPKSYTTAFEDVTSGSYYYQAVLWAVENGIAQGTSETTFEPDAVCTRAQIVCFLFRYKAANGMDAVTLAELLGGYADSAEIPAYSRAALNWAISANVLQGSGEKLLPNDPCTRAQIVTFLYRAMQ